MCKNDLFVTLRAGAMATLLVLPLAGCDLDGVLEVTDPSRLLAENVETPEQVEALMNGLEADFQCAFGNYVLTTADFSDELEDTNAGGDNWSLDRRRPLSQDAWSDNDCGGLGAYVPASRSRWVADNLVRLLSGWTDQEVSDREERLARAYLLSGFSLYMLGAAHCSVALDEGPELSSMQVFAEGEARFSDALALAQTLGLTATENAALVGRARLRFFQGNTAAGLADAQAVVAGFVMNVFPSDATGRTRNTIFNADQRNFSFGVPEWSRDLLTEGVSDPRTGTFDTGQFTGWAPGSNWAQTKYATADAPMPIARWEEAQLIIAEIQGGPQAVSIINGLRAPWSIPVFSSTDPVEIQNTIVDERQRELWFEGHRAYDVHRLSLPFFPAAGDPYQAGVKGGTYGDQTCIPLPNVERFNNLSIRGI
jgi:hypothetical protein